MGVAGGVFVWGWRGSVVIKEIRYLVESVIVAVVLEFAT